MSSFIEQIVEGIAGMLGSRYDDELQQMRKEVKAHDEKLDKVVKFLGVDDSEPKQPEG